MSDLLGIGASAVSTYSAALGVIGENVANAQTEGYARRDIHIQPVAGGNGSGLYTNVIGMGGAQATSVSRAWDQYKSNDALSATADDGRASAAANWLASAGATIDDTDTGVGAQVTSVFTAANTLAADPTNATARTQMIGALGNAASAISGAATKLARVSDGIGAAATDGVTAVNNDLAALSKLNTMMLRSTNGSDAKASLADQRDQLLSDLSSRIGVDARIGTDGTVSLSLSGSAGATLLSGVNVAVIAVQQASDGRLSFTAGLDGTATAVSPTGGTLAGLGDAANTVAGMRQGLDATATDFATKVNNWNAGGLTTDGKAGVPLLSIAGGAAGLKLATTSGDAIAAAGTDGTANGNLVAFNGLRGAGGTEAQLNALVGQSAQAAASAKAQASAAATRKEAALTAQGDVNGVSLDQEAADLVRYQQAYQGSAKIIQAAQTTMNSILALFGG